MAFQISGHMLKCLITVSELKAALKDGGHYGVVLDIQNYSGLRHDGTIWLICLDATKCSCINNHDHQAGWSCSLHLRWMGGPKVQYQIFLQTSSALFICFTYSGANINSSCQSSQDLLKGCGYAPSYDDGCIESLCFSHGVLQHLYNCSALSNGNAALIVYRGSGMLNQIADCWLLNQISDCWLLNQIADCRSCPELHCWCDTVALGALWANSEWW